MPPRAPRLDREQSGTIALQVVAFLAADEQRLSRFLSLTGTDESNLRELIADDGFQAAALEYLLQDESLMLVFCAEQGVPPEVMQPAHALLTRYHPE